MAKATEKKSVIIIRSRDSYTAPPGPMGFENLLEPDTRFDPAFKVQMAYSEEAFEALIAGIEKYVIDPLWEKFDAEARENGMAGKRTYKRPDARQYVEDHMKPPHEKAKVQLPTIEFKGKTERKMRGEIVPVTMLAWSASGGLLDLKALKLARGSIIQPVLTPGIFMNALMPPQPSLSLTGIRVLKAERYEGGGSRNPGTEADEAIALLGDDFEVDDLSAFAAGMSAGAEAKPAKGRPPSDDFEDDVEIPF